MEIFKCNSFALLAPTAMAYAPLWALPPTLETTTIPSKTKDLNDKNKCLHILQFILFLFIYLLLLVAFDAWQFHIIHKHTIYLVLKISLN